MLLVRFHCLLLAAICYDYGPERAGTTPNIQVTGRIQFNESVAGHADDSHNLLFGVFDLVNTDSIAKDVLHLVDLGLHLSRVDFNLFAVEVDSHNLIKLND